VLILNSLILGSGFLLRSTSCIPAVVTFSLREKGYVEFLDGHQPGALPSLRLKDSTPYLQKQDSRYEKGHKKRPSDKKV